MFVYVGRSVCVLVVLLTVVKGQLVEDLDQDELIDEELENTLLEEDDLLEEELEEEILGEDVVEENLELDILSPAINLKAGESIAVGLPSLNGTILAELKEVVGESQQVFATSFFVTVMSELGDKTFFLSAILAMHHSRLMTFIGSTIGQTIMTLVAVIFGMAASLIPEFYTQWASAIIMTFFGIKMLKDSTEMDSNSIESNKEKVETENTNKQLEKSESKNDEKIPNSINNTVKNNNRVLANGDIKHHLEEKNGVVQNGVLKRELSEKPPEYTKGVLLQSLTLCLMGEWGDKSQIATILLASNEDPYTVAAGGIVGHILCNIIAVFGGRMLASKFPAKFVTQIGGVFFLLAAASTFVFS